ncbi:MAG: hypothetical protein Q9173_001836 [Seirophora scorigena]
MMLLAQSITANHQLPHNEASGALAKTALEDRIPVVAVQILTEILSTQHEDGTWGSNDRVEETIQYPAVILLELASLPYTVALRTEIQDAISKAREALSTRQNAISNRTQSPLLSLADIHPDAVEGCLHQNAQAKQTQKISGFVTYFSSLDHIKNLQPVRIKASILEASLYRPFLKAARRDIFPPSTSKEQDKYLDYIPIMWLLASASYRVFVPPEYLLDMMILSMWIFLADEYMESRIVKLPAAEFRQFRKYVEEDLYTGARPQQTSQDNTTVLQEARSVFTAFANAVLSYPSLASASATDLLDLRFETKNYLLHHLDQLEDNLRLVHQPSPQSTTSKTTIRKKFLTPRTSFQTWIHTTAAGHISGPFAWAFFTCCMSSFLSSPQHHPPSRGEKVKKDCFRTPRQKLMAHGLNAHYGAFCRLYNDYGSVARDAAEGNLNSLNFPEFFPPSPTSSSSSSSSSFSSSPPQANDENSCPSEEEKEEAETKNQDRAAKSLLLSAARYERSCALTTMETLCRELEEEGKEPNKAGKRKGKKKWLADRIRVYVGAGEQFSDMYLTRDVTNGVK